MVAAEELNLVLPSLAYVHPAAIILWPVTWAIRA